MANIWTVANNYTLGTLVERIRQEPGDLPLPINSNATVELISGKLPRGMRLDNNELNWDTDKVSVYGISFACSEAL